MLSNAPAVLRKILINFSLIMGLVLLSMAVSAHVSSKSASNKGISNKSLEKIVEPIVIRVTGYGVLEKSSANMVVSETGDIEKKSHEKNVVDSKKENMQTTGQRMAKTQSVPGMESKRLMAIRASKLDAYRALAERIYGISISGSSTVQDFVLKSDSFGAAVDSYVRGARVVSIIENKHTGYETVLEVLLPGDFQDCLNKVNNFKYGVECLRPVSRHVNRLEGSAASVAVPTKSNNSMQSVYFLK